MKIRTTLKKGITVPSLIFIIGVCLISAVYPQLTEQVLNVVKNFIFVNFNWIYIWAVTLFVIFLVYIMASSYGNIRLGRNDSKPEYSFFSWLSMLFAAGMGIGLMYFSVAEPMQHYSNGIFAYKSLLKGPRTLSCIPFSTGGFMPGPFMAWWVWHSPIFRTATGCPCL